MTNESEGNLETPIDSDKEEIIKTLLNVRLHLDLDLLNEKYLELSEEERSEHYETMLKLNFFSFLKQFEDNPEDITGKEWSWFSQVVKYLKIPVAAQISTEGQ